MLTDVCKKHEYIIIKSWAKYLKCSISIQTNITIKNILFCPPLLYSHEVIVFKIYLNGFKIQSHPPHPSSKPGRLLAWAPNLEHQVCILQERQYCNITFIHVVILPSQGHSLHQWPACTATRPLCSPTLKTFYWCYQQSRW